MRDFKKKNYYMLKSLEKEIERAEAVSFEIFETLLLYTTFQPEDFRLELQDYVAERYGIQDFAAIRSNMSCNYPLESMREQYRHEEERYQVDFTDAVNKELELLKKYTTVNPLIQRLFQQSIDKNKTVVLFSECSYTTDEIRNLLEYHGIPLPEGQLFIYTTGEKHLCKPHFDLFRLACNEVPINRSKWLHIGCNYAQDYDTTRRHGLTAYYYETLRERYLENQKDLAETEGRTFDFRAPGSIEESIGLAQEIIKEYSEIREPSEEVAIHAENIGMMFNMSSEKIDNLKEYFVKLIKRQLLFKEFWALRNISFDVHKGEKVGLIGLNGSGKSTTLKIVSGVLKATEGKVWVKGSVAPLIELGAGFDDKLSARENVYLNGAILGYSRKQMDEVYDGIIDFSELREFEDVAIKNYSSGMVARLGFAIATSHVPDVLIIDEILSVGDYEFQKKCHRRMQELTGMGATVLFVSHSSGDIINMCYRAIWLDHGQLVDEGEAEFVIGKYIKG